MLKKVMIGLIIFIVGSLIGGIGSYMYTKSTLITPKSVLKEKTEQTPSIKENIPEKQTEPSEEKRDSQIKELEDQMNALKAEANAKDKEKARLYYLVNDFAEKWVNYKGIYERNQSVRHYLTDKAIEENGIDVDPHVEQPTTGEIYQVSQNMKNDKQYTIFGRERSLGGDNLIVILIGLDKDYQKIDQIKISYVRTAY